MMFKKRFTIFAAVCTLTFAHATLAQTQPRIVQIEPASNVPLPEQAVFAIKTSSPVKGKPQASCDVWGIRSSVPTETIPEPRRSAVLKAYGLGAEVSNPQWLVLRCQMALPDAARISLRWHNAERPSRDEPEMGDRWDGQYFNYVAHSDLPVSIECNRSNASSGCNPLEAVQLVFTQALSTSDAKNIAFKDAQGKRYAPDMGEDSGISVDKVSFKGLPLEQTLSLEWPARLNSAEGKQFLSAAARAKPLTVRMGGYPPLVKFTSTFGLAEKAIGGIVPMTVRAIEAAPETGHVKLRQLKLTDEASIIEVMQTLSKVSRADGTINPNGYEDNDGEGGEPDQPTAKKGALRYPFAFPKDRQQGVDTRGIAWLKNIKSATVQDLPKQLGGAEFEVLGVPLKEAGLYVLEAESLFLGRALLDKNRPMYVRSGALVTDLGVHMHTALRTTAVWVTQLSTGKPVADAAVSIYDCKAKRIAQGSTNEAGWVQLDAKYDNNHWRCPLYAFAKKADDLSFVQSNWQRGIQSWRFESLKNIYATSSGVAVHTVLARNLLKGGETLHAKHYWRALNSRGDMVPPRKADLPTTLQLVHIGSNERVTVPVSWDSRGNAATVYPIPAGAKRGVYHIEFPGNNDCYYSCNTQYRVEDFRLPVLKAEVLSPKVPVMIGDSINTLLRLNYLAGGAAAGEKVTVSQRVLRYTPSFSDYEGFYFGADNQWEADSEDALESDIDTAANTANAQNSEDKQHTLNANGTLTITNSLKKSNGQAKSLLTEMEYRDPNGETYRAQGRTTVWPASVLIGHKVEGWASGASRKAEFLTLSPDGKPMPNTTIDVYGALQGYISHRVRTVGGFYSYKSEQRNDELKTLCTGRSNAQGRFVCEFKPNVKDIDSGEFKVQANATDSKGRKSTTQTTLWLYSGEDVWFSQGDHDRMDVLTDTPKVKAGDVATLQVRSPFREATAWVNVMRSGAVIDTLVVPLTGKNPSIKLPIKASYEPNVFVNVLAVRGRVAEPVATALVDLARPAFKLGLIHLDVASQSHELKVKVSTDKTAYQSRETATASIQVDAPAGKALPEDREVTVFAIDEALLELLPNHTWDVVKAMFAQRGYGFETASANMQIMGKRHYGRKALPAGGGGGRSGARELFETLLVWQGSVKLDASGKASVKIPINDSLTKFRVIAVANAGSDLFGTGQTSFTASKDLQILSGLPISAREGDAFAAAFTLRNTTQAPMQVTASAKVGEQSLDAQTLPLAAGEAKTVSWRVAVPLDAKQLNWRIDASSNTGRKDALIIKQAVIPALTALRYTVGASSVDANKTFALAPPAASVANKGEVLMSLAPAFATDAASVRDYMRSYPFYCLEQRTSKAISLRDAALWNVIYDTLDQYVTDSGLVNYYPGQYGYDRGYDVLTSFVLSAAHEAKFKLPDQARQRMLEGLKQFILGKLERRYDYYGDDGYGLTERKLLALEAYARYNTVPPAMTESLRLSPNDLPKLSNRALVQWVDVLNRVDWPNKALLLESALAALNSRIQIDSTGGLRLKNSQSDNRWYMMYSDDATAARLALLALDVPALKNKADGIARGALATQRGGGHWWQTQANVWGSLMLDKRATQATGELTGSTVLTVGKNTVTHDWGKAPQGGAYRLPSTGADGVQVAHSGTGKPYVSAYGLAWADIKTPQQQNATVSKTIKPIKQAVAGQYSVGDVLEVQLKFSSKNGMGWIALTDPIPTGATLLGGGLKGLSTVQTQEKRGHRNDDGSYEAYPSYVERTATVIRSYYEYLWGANDTFTMTYQVRLNNAGTFALPPTQLEAMYDPDHFAYRPNAVMVVK